MDGLVTRIDRTGADVARRFLIARERDMDEDVMHFRWELLGMSTIASFVTGEQPQAIERRWIEAGAEHSSVPEAARAKVAAERERRGEPPDERGELRRLAVDADAFISHMRHRGNWPGDEREVDALIGRLRNAGKPVA